MNLNRYGSITWPLAAIVIFAGTGMAAPAAGQPAGSSVQSREAARLLRDIRMDARQVRAHAWRWTMLTDTRTATWYKFDKQWNEIKPPVEDMSMKLVRLEDMSASLPPLEQKAIAESEPLVARIAGETHALRTELDKSYTHLSNLSNPALKGNSKILARDAGQLVRTVERPKAAQAWNAPMTKNS